MESSVLVTVLQKRIKWMVCPWESWVGPQATVQCLPSFGQKGNRLSGGNLGCSLYDSYDFPHGIYYHRWHEQSNIQPVRQDDVAEMSSRRATIAHQKR